MKKLFTLLLMPLMLGALAACSDSSEELVKPEEAQDEVIPTGTRIGDFIVSYYWFKGGKVPIYLYDTSCMIIYHSEDEDSIIAKLEEMGLTKDDMKGKADYILYPSNFENPSKLIYEYQDTKRATIDIDYKQALEIPDVIYATPYVSTDFGRVFPMSNFIYIQSNDFYKIEKKANELNVVIIGKIRGVVGDYYSAICNRESKGNPLEIANAFHEAGIIAEPAFVNAAGGSITD